MKRAIIVPMFLLLIAMRSFAVLPTPPSGTVLPVMLDTTLHSGMKPGASIHATIMQDVPLPDRGKIPVGSKLVGHVVSASASDITIQFDTLKVKGNVIPVATSLRAIAGPLDVQDAETPNSVSERNTPPWEGNTNQIGGEVAYRDADLMDGLEPVGKALVGGGALAALRASPRGCSADPNVQALWVFSTTACGVYGDMDLKIAHDGRTVPIGQIVLHSDQKLLVREGSGLMLRVVTAHK